MTTALNWGLALLVIMAIVGALGIRAILGGILGALLVAFFTAHPAHAHPGHGATAPHTHDRVAHAASCESLGLGLVRCVLPSGAVLICERNPVTNAVACKRSVSF